MVRWIVELPWSSGPKLLPERREGGWSAIKTEQEWPTSGIPSCKAFCQQRWLNLKPSNFPNNELVAELFHAYCGAACSHIGWVCGISPFIILHAFSWIVFQFASNPFLSMWFPWWVAYVCSDRDSCLFFTFVESTMNWKYSWDCISLTSFYSLQMSGSLSCIQKKPHFSEKKKVLEVQSSVSGIYIGIYSTCLFLQSCAKLFKERGFFPMRHDNACDTALCKQQS